jgi:hypothetical protein
MSQKKVFLAAFSPHWPPRLTRRFGLGSDLATSKKGASWSFCGDSVRPRVYSASAKGIAHTEKTAGKKTLDILTIVLPHPKAVFNLLPICYQFLGKRYQFVTNL